MNCPMNTPEVIFISGIDTDAGKSYATGHLANMLTSAGRRVITQKFVQTGCGDMSEDIELHRRIMGIPLQPRDLDHTTAPLIFSYPCSPQLAARIDNRTIDLDIVDAATRRLSGEYDTVLIEGAGGLMVPLTDAFLTIDYPATRRLPIALVTNSRLGSINHTLLALEAIRSRNIPLHSILYNHHFDAAAGPMITDDTYAFLQRYIERYFPDTPIIDVPTIAL